MADYHDDEEIRKLMRSFRASRPPEDLLKNYEQDVLKKIHAGQGRGMPAAGAFALAACGIALLAAGVYLLAPRPQALRPAPAAEETAAPSPVFREAAPAPAVTVPPQEAGTATAVEDEQDTMAARDLLILEMLGEDEGLNDGFDRMASDAEFWTPPAPAGIAS